MKGTGIKGKIRKATARIKQAREMATNAGNELVVAYSGGKDSDVLLDIAVRSGIPIRVEHNLSTVDAPETIYHVQETFYRLESLGIPCKINRPDITMWQLIPKKLIPPTRRARYCCAHFKERRFENQHLLLGIRWAESPKRRERGAHELLDAKKESRVVYTDENDKKRKLVEICGLRGHVATNPIIDWTTDEIWEYIRETKIKPNPLYERGCKRVGCIGCPMAGKARGADFERYPKYKAAYIRAFDRMLEAKRESHRRRGKEFTPDEKWSTGAGVFDWWISS